MKLPIVVWLNCIDFADYAADRTGSVFIGVSLRDLMHRFFILAYCMKMRSTKCHFDRIRSAIVSAIVAAMVFVPALSTGQPPQLENLPLTETALAQLEVWGLPELQAWAEENSPDLRRAAAEVEVQRGRAWQAGLYPNPELQGGSNQLGGRESQYFAMLSQEIVTHHKLKLDRAAVCREVVQAELQFVRARFDLLTNVRQSYYATLIAQYRIDALRQLLNIAQRSTEAAQRLEKSGEGARGDTLLLELELDKADFALQTAATLLMSSQRQLAAIIGDPDLNIERLEGDFAQRLPDYPYQLTQAGVLTRHSEVQSAQVEIERNQILLDRAVAEPRSNVTVQGGYLYQVAEPHDLAIVQLSLPIPIWNQNDGAIRAARASVTRASHASRKTQFDLVRQLAAATGRFDVARQQVEKYETSILPKAKESVRITQRGFEQGQFDLLRILQSQRVLIESELNYLTAQDARWSAAAEIAGMLQEEDFPQRVPPAKE